MKRQSLYFLAALAVASLASVAQAQKVGPQFQVNLSNTAVPELPDVASDSAGNFMVVWRNKYYGYDIFGRSYDSDGNPLSDQFLIGEAGDPAIAATNSNFIVVWGDREHSVLGQLYDINGNPLGDQLPISAARVEPQVASDASGNFVVVYGSGGRRFDSDGNPLGDPFSVSGSHSVASDANGNFVVAWTSLTYPGTYSVLGQRYDKTGRPLGDNFQVNTFTGDYQFANSVAATSDGHFLVVWQSDGDLVRTGLDNDGFGVYGQFYDQMGTRVGGNVQVNQYTTCWQHSADTAVDKDGNFVITWENSHFCSGVFGRRYDVHGRPLTNEFRVNTGNNGYAGHPAVASASSGSFVVVWDALDRYEQNGFGIYGQRFSTDCQASVAVEGDVQTPGGTLRVQVHIAHHRPKTITVPWELRLLDANGQRIVKHATEPHTFEPGDVVDRSVEFRLPDDLAAGTYTLELAISGMAGTKGAATTFRVVRAE